MNMSVGYIEFFSHLKEGKRQDVHKSIVQDVGRLKGLMLMIRHSA